MRSSRHAGSKKNRLQSKMRKFNDIVGDLKVMFRSIVSRSVNDLSSSSDIWSNRKIAEENLRDIDKLYRIEEDMGNLRRQNGKIK